MPPASDLAARILAEIERRETWLRSFDDPWIDGPRTLNQHEALISLAFENLTCDTTITRDDVDAILTVVLPDADRQVMDPQAELRRCAADRKIVDRYLNGKMLTEATAGTILAKAAQVRFGAYEAVLGDLADGYGVTVDGAE